MGVGDLWRYLEFLCGCKSCPREKTHGYGYHIELELGVGVGTDSGLVTHWRIASGVGGPTRARYMDVIHDMD